MAGRTFNPKRGLGAEARLLHIEEHLASLFTGGGTISDVRPVSGGTPVADALGDLSGDVEGAATDNTVIGLQTVPLAETAPATGQLLGYDGTNWTPTAGVLDGDVEGALSTTTVVAIQNRAVQDVDPDDYDLLTWDLGNLRWTSRSGYRVCLVQGWMRSDVTAAPTSLTEMPRWDGTIGNKLHGEYMSHDYRLLLVVLSLDAPLNIDATSYSVEVFAGGLSTGFTAGWLGHTGSANTVITSGVGDVTLVRAASPLTVKEIRVGVPDAVRAQATIYIDMI